MQSEKSMTKYYWKTLTGKNNQADLGIDWRIFLKNILTETAFEMDLINRTG
jgi:hypothetical protein